LTDLEQRVAKLTPLFGYLFGIREWEMDQLTHAGFLAYEQFANAWLKEGGGERG